MIQHVTREILPSEADEATTFYGLLGFERVPEPASVVGRAVWLERSGTQIHLMFVDEPTAAERRPSGHIGVVVDDYRDTVRRVQNAGHDVEPRREHWGSPRSYVRDPAGYLVELIAWPPPHPGKSPA
jgi:catechol 2,3-dioxygenase-like lactoylglutathione lyase family enzyme